MTEAKQEKTSHAKLKGRLLAFDVDGTLLNYRGELTERTINALASASGAGAVLTLATGRDWGTLGNLLTSLPTVQFALCTNGTEAYDREGELIYARQIPVGTAIDLVSAVREQIKDAAIGAAIGKEMVGEPEIVDAMPAGITLSPGQIVDDILTALKPEIRDLVIYHRDYIHRLDELFSLTVDICKDFDVGVQYSGLPMMELLPTGSGKGTGLAWLAGHLGIEQTDVVAFGDGLNDLSMLKWAGTGVAMGQSEERVQDAANVTTESCDNEGVAEWIEKQLKQ
tara:strand:+ start:160 stop:1005 length:846 start_codon:yes stop_codon:yes gene_type:complete